MSLQSKIDISFDDQTYRNTYLVITSSEVEGGDVHSSVQHFDQLLNFEAFRTNLTYDFRLASRGVGVLVDVLLLNSTRQNNRTGNSEVRYDLTRLVSLRAESDFLRMKLHASTQAYFSLQKKKRDARDIASD